MSRARVTRSHLPLVMPSVLKRPVSTERAMLLVCPGSYPWPTWRDPKTTQTCFGKGHKSASSANAWPHAVTKFDRSLTEVDGTRPNSVGGWADSAPHIRSKSVAHFGKLVEHWARTRIGERRLGHATCPFGGDTPERIPRPRWPGSAISSDG